MKNQLFQFDMWTTRIALIIVVLTVLGSSLTTVDAQSECGPESYTQAWPFTDFCKLSIDIESEVIPVIPRDNIPAITDPTMETIAEARDWLNGRSPVIVVEVDGEARAYPHAILMWHEIANDTIADVPIAVTFCPLCNSSIVFDRRVDDEVLEFGVSGLLRNSDLIMYDRTTFSWFQQFVGTGIAGEHNEVVLDVVPSLLVSFDQFAERYPDGLVMSSDTGFRRSYGYNPYEGLDDSDTGVIRLFTGDYDNRVTARERVLAGEIDGVEMAYPFSILSSEFVINDTLGTMSVVAMWQPGMASSLDRASIEASRDVGTAVLYDRTLEDGRILEFRYDEANGMIVDAETGSTWNIFGEAIGGELEGTILNKLIAAPHYWFAWAAFHPETEVYGQ